MSTALATTATTAAPRPRTAAAFAALHNRLGRLLHKRLFFIVGCQKSGTTWLQHLLDGHPHIRCNGEAYFGLILLPALKQAVELYNQKQKVGPDGLFSEADLLHLFRTAVGLSFARWVDDDDAIQCIDEKTPEHALCTGLLDQAFPEAKFIHIILDGDTICLTPNWVSLLCDVFDQGPPHLGIVGPKKLSQKRQPMLTTVPQQGTGQLDEAQVIR